MIAEVIINRTAKKLNRTFDYRVPQVFEGLIFVGSKVLVPFGKVEKLEEAFVVKLKNETIIEKNQIKEIKKIEEQLKDEKIELAKWMAKRYFSNVSDCIKLMLTPGTRTKNKEKRVQDKLINCVYFAKDSDNVEIEYGSNYCDQPNKYDTGVSGNVNVYIYDADTNTRGSLATYVTSDEGKLYNMIPNQIYYWESAADSSINGYVKPIGERRIISIDNSQDNTVHKVRNVRDLGGIKVDTDGDGTTDGTIKYAKLYRGTRIWGGDGNTKPYFDKLGISNEVDLRESNEPDASLEDKLTNYYLKTIIHYNIAYADDATNGNYTKARNTAIFIMNQFIEAHENGDDDYAMFFHCRVGADRTGTIAYILEGLLGASEEERYRDYEMTVFFGLRERTRFYYSKGSNTVKFQFMKNAFKATSNNNTEDVLAWFLAGSSDTESDMELVNKFRSVMIDYN